MRTLPVITILLLLAPLTARADTPKKNPNSADAKSTSNTDGQLKTALATRLALLHNFTVTYTRTDTRFSDKPQLHGQPASQVQWDATLHVLTPNFRLDETVANITGTPAATPIKWSFGDRLQLADTPKLLLLVHLGGGPPTSNDPGLDPSASHFLQAAGLRWQIDDTPITPEELVGQAAQENHSTLTWTPGPKPTLTRTLDKDPARHETLTFDPDHGFALLSSHLEGDDLTVDLTAKDFTTVDGTQFPMTLERIARTALKLGGPATLETSRETFHIKSWIPKDPANTPDSLQLKIPPDTRPHTPPPKPK